MFHFTREKPCFGINPLGEVFINDEYAMGDVNVCDCARRILSVDEYSTWSNEYQQHPDLEAKVEAEIAHEFEREARNCMNSVQYALYKQITDLQVVDDGRWRIYGGQVEGQEPEINLVTEVLEFCDDSTNDFWETLYATAKELGAEVSIMSEEKHHDKFKKIDDADWSYGPHHGRMERQVEIIWNVYGKSVDEVRAIIADLNPKLDEIWEKAGVSVC